MIHNKTKWIVTATNNICKECDKHNGAKKETPSDVIIVPCIAYGSINDYSNWTAVCKDHLSTVVCKKQHCNHCNKNATIKVQPRICSTCAEKMLNTYVQLNKECHYPNEM